jgi:hypothetical protein
MLTRLDAGQDAAELAGGAALVAIIALGLVMLLVARFILRSPFFGIRRAGGTQAG